MIVCLQLLPSLATLSQARAAPTPAAPTPVNDQVPVSDASSSSAPASYDTWRPGPLPGFTPGFHAGPGGYGGQQTGPGGYGRQQAGPGSYAGQQPAHGGQPGFGNLGYGSGPMSAPQPCVPYGGFGPFVDGLGGYYGKPFGGFGGQMRKSGRYGGFGKYGGVGMNFGGFGGKYGGFYPFGDYEDMFDDRNDDDFLADLYGVDQEDDEHLTSTSARLEKYLQKQWQLGKRKLQVQVDFGNVPLEWEYLNQYHGVRHPLSKTAFGPKYGLGGPPAPMFDYGFGPTGPIGGFGGPGFGYGGPGFGPGYGSGAPPAPGYGLPQVPGYGQQQGQPGQQQQQAQGQQQQAPATAQQPAQQPAPTQR